ncbi:hypothetical protein [Flavobacterium limnosediminis]|uniref:hypothetical protein n=1 Tax=Flavobacterium limnosediminis TaxID=1401027 RepID=UPI0012DBCB79|nr:hypothetical protein [Flavobacterium limnosediminis]
MTKVVGFFLERPDSYREVCAFLPSLFLLSAVSFVDLVKKRDPQKDAAPIRAGKELLDSLLANP